MDHLHIREQHLENNAIVVSASSAAPACTRLMGWPGR